MVREQAADSSVAVVVVSYNTRELLARCLESLSHEEAAEIIVVDNASTDGSAAMVRERFPGVRVVVNERNIGYGAAANEGVRSASAPLVLLLNADTTVDAGCIPALAGVAQRAGRAAIVAPAIVNRKGVAETSCFPFPGTLGWLLENEPIATVARRVGPLRRRAVSFDPPREAHAVPWALGCALLVRRSALEEVGGFDDSFFMYYEEVDLSRRLADAGWEVWFTPDARITHVGGASTSQVRTAMLIQHFESTVRYYRRHHSGPRLAFWLAVLRAKRLAMLARDSAQLLRTTEPAERERLREQCRAWSAILGLTPVAPGGNGGAPGDESHRG
jgi:GT2 family glycosyltransferase